MRRNARDKEKLKEMGRNGVKRRECRKQKGRGIKGKGKEKRKKKGMRIKSRSG